VHAAAELAKHHKKPTEIKLAEVKKEDNEVHEQEQEQETASLEVGTDLIKDAGC
jgi:hypothetical protein